MKLEKRSFYFGRVFNYGPKRIKFKKTRRENQNSTIYYLIVLELHYLNKYFKNMQYSSPFPNQRIQSLLS